MTAVNSGGVWGILPVKSFRHGKSRLFGATCQSERRLFNEHCANHVLKVLCGCSQLDEILIATNDDSIARWANKNNVYCLRDNEGDVLNDVIAAALAFSQQKKARSAIILFSDLPFLDGAALQGFIEKMAEADCVIAPDRHSKGTNALGVRFPAKVSLCFEQPNSFLAHQESCIKKAIDFCVVREWKFGFDVDLPADFEEFKRLSDWGERSLKNVS